jgi:peroxiredoxin
MKFLTLAFAAMLLAVSPSLADNHAEVGKPAPDFTAKDTNGKDVKLSDLKGKIVVLEWTNPECPYVVKHYETKNMQALQAELVGDDVAWLTISSSAKGKQGHMTPEQANAYIKEQGSKETARILDEDGTIGKLYGAKTTPHMFVINKDGVVAYAGAIDDNDSFKHDTVKGAKNFIREAVNELKAGKPVTTASTKPYGCSVKY